MPRGSRVDLFSLLEETRSRPYLYAGSNELADLWTWLQGVDFGLQRVGGGLVSDPAFYHFHRFVQLRLGFRESTSGWARMIGERSGSEPGAAMRDFYELFDEFRALGPTRHVAEMADRAAVIRTNAVRLTDDRGKRLAKPTLSLPVRLDLYELPPPIGWYYYDRDESPRDYPPSYVAGPEQAYAVAEATFGVRPAAWRRPRRSRPEPRAF